MVMKTANILLSIFILIFATASAVFSFFLFEKRSQFVDGWSKMAVAVNKTAVALDNGSGIESIAKDLSAENLSHKKYADLDKQLPKLSKRAEEVAKSRSLLAAALNTIGENTGANLSSSPWSLNNYDGSRSKVLNAFSRTINNRDAQFRKFKDICKKYFNIEIDIKQLQSGSSVPMNKVAQKFGEEAARRSKYESTLRSIASSTGTKFDARNYAASASNITKGVSTLKNNLNKANSTIKSKDAQIKNKDAQIKKQQALIERRNNELKARDKRIADLKKALGMDVKDDTPLWAAGSAEARKQLVGKVIEVDEGHGYIVVDLGKNTRVIQTLGKKTVEIDPRIVKGLELVVVDGDIADAAKFVSRIKVDEVGDKCSTANIPAGSKAIKSGYMVYWIPAAK